MSVKRQMIRLLVLIAIVQVVLPVLLLLARNKILFFPAALPTAEDRIGEFRGLDARVVQIPRPDGRMLDAYDARPAGKADPTRPVVLFFHGNAGNIGHRAGLIAWLVETTEARVVLASYSGYGGNAGSPSEATVYEDALAAYDWLAAQGVAGSQIVVFGVSIGSGPASYVASERQVAGLVLQSPLASLSSMALRTYPWLPLCSLFTLGDFPVATRVGKMTVPVLVAHGEADRIVPFSEGEKVRAAAGDRGELYRVDLAGHNDLFDEAGKAYLLHLRDRFREWTGVSSGAGE